MSWQKEELESVACDLCGSTEQKPIIKRPDGLSVVECRHCALCYLSPRPNPQRVAKLYRAEYFQNQTQNCQVGYANYLAADARRGQRLEAQSRFATIRKFSAFKGTRVLEIGCATGEFSGMLHRRGLRVTGIDISPQAIRHAKARFPDVEFNCGDITCISRAAKFDLVCAFEVIEHVLSPRKFLDQIGQSLSKEGILVLSTPNYECAKRIGADSWIGFHTSFEHLYFLCPATILKYSEDCGFEPVEWLTDNSNAVCNRSSVGQPEPACSPRLATQLLGTLGLLQPARMLKHVLACRYGANYAPGGAGHNLFVILKKRAALPQRVDKACVTKLRQAQ